MNHRLIKIAMPAMVAMLGVTVATGAFATPNSPQIKSSEPVKQSPARPMKVAERKPERAMILQVRAQDNRATEALNSLEASGFTTFANFRVDGKVFSADVTRNNNITQVRIDPDADRVTTPSA